MKSLLLLALVLCGALAHARPLVLEEKARLPKPDASYDTVGIGVGLDGDYALLLGSKTLPDPGGNDDTQRTAFLFRMINGVWTYVRPLSSTVEGNEGDGPAAVGLDMANGIAVLGLQPLRVFERVGSDYVLRQEFSGDSRTSHMQIDGDRFIFGGGCWGAGVLARDANGNWMSEGSLPADFCGSTDSATGGPAGLNSNLAVVASPWGYNPEGGFLGPSVESFRYVGGTGPNQWEHVQRVVPEPGHVVGHVAMQSDYDGNRLFVGDLERYGTTIYEGDYSGNWYLSFRRLLSGGEAMLGNDFGGPYHHDGAIEATPDYVMRHVYDYDRGAKVVQVFQWGLNGYLHVATLVPSDGGVLTGQIAISGRRVLLAGAERAYYYELPESLATPAVIQESFSTTTTPGWTAQPGSQYTVVQRSDSRVFRQASTAGEAGATLNAANWTNQAIEADVKPWAVDGADRWVGLVTRRADAANYYYVTLRSGGSIQLKRMVGGSFQTLASAPLPFVLSRLYRIRLESIGSLHRVYVDGAKLLEARDGALAQGRPGVLSYRAAVDYDNVVVSPSPRLTLFQQLTNDPCIPTCANLPGWTTNGGQWTRGLDGTNAVLAQNSLTDWARVYAGQPTDNTDMAVEARVRLRAFGAGSDPWFGVMAAVGGDATSYTYLVLRKSNTVTLRKVYAGQVVQLGSAVFNVKPGAWYKLRLEAIGTRLRGYIDNRLVLEANNDQPWVGAGGLVTFHTQADFAEYRAVRP